ncbi:ankyrin repeat-containing domain protein [Podospora fimiseda]|uniref:Ankyrin repeat-containing domain protein n=1 Tax=Podospora fimiseda TaxID=252190 RepID=A0AAN7BXF0_9PEZI|nr:ankyrin repeat-containing domain protein [Podospora fimiseda]
MVAALKTEYETEYEGIFHKLLSYGYKPGWGTLKILSQTNNLTLAKILIDDQSLGLSRQTLERVGERLEEAIFDDEETDHCPLTVAVIDNNPDMLRLLLRTDLNIDDTDGLNRGDTNRSAFQRAVENGNLELMEILLKAGADVNVPTAIDRGATALQLTAIKGHLGIAKALLDRGANLSAQ